MHFSSQIMKILLKVIFFKKRIQANIYIRKPTMWQDNGFYEHSRTNEQYYADKNQ